MVFIHDAQLRLRTPSRFACVLAALCIATASPSFAQSNAPIVGNDRGGVIGARAAEITRIKAANRRVESLGSICLSSCTMYLGAGNVCASPETRFGFHGPPYYGRPLQPAYFEYWSDVLASHYPPGIREWFLTGARYKTDSYITVLGKELVRHGVPACR